jgi:hypothetical protein
VSWEEARDILAEDLLDFRGSPKDKAAAEKLLICKAFFNEEHGRFLAKAHRARDSNCSFLMLRIDARFSAPQFWEEITQSEISSIFGDG